MPYWASPNAADFHSGSNLNMRYLAYFQDFQFLISDFHHIDFDRAQFIIHVYICTFSLTDTESIKQQKHRGILLVKRSIEKVILYFHWSIHN